MLSLNIERLMGRIFALGAIGALPQGGAKRLALTQEDGEGRALVTGWFESIGLEVFRDPIGNTWAVRPDRHGSLTAPVLMGSHIDTVATGGLYDGVLGVLAALEVIESTHEAGIATERPLAVAFFTNEEGARFAPDMMGSAVSQGALDLEEMLAVEAIDGQILRDALNAIGAAGDAPLGSLRPSCYLELHIEQGPLLEAKGLDIGVVTGVQGISWNEFTIQGRSSHAGTTPMALRRDAGVVASALALEVHQIAQDFGPPQVATVGRMQFFPNLVNVVPDSALMTADLRHTDDATLARAEARLMEKAQSLASAQNCTISHRSLARIPPVEFNATLVAEIAQQAQALGFSQQFMPSGAGHDAQMFAPNCPSAMIFIPSKDGLSHNTAEYSSPAQIAKGAQLLAAIALARANAPLPL